MSKKKVQVESDIEKWKRVFDSAHSISKLGLKHIKKYSSNLGMLFSQTETVVLCGLATGQSRALLRRYIPITGQLAAALFKLGNPRCTEAAYQLEADMQVPGTEPIHESELHEGNWLSAYYWNKIAEQEKQIQWLLDFPTSILIRSSTSGPKLHSALVESVKAFELNSRAFPRLIKGAIKLGQAELRNTWVKNEGLLICKLLAAVHDAQENLTEVVSEVVAGHQRLVETMEVYRDSPAGLFSVSGAALIRIARTRGLRVDVESNYLPDLFTVPNADTRTK